MTVRYRWSAQAESPLHLAAARERGELGQTLPYVPGTALRGAVAAIYLTTGERPASEFQQFANQVAFGNLYPVSDATATSVPAPRSWVTCSHWPGLLADGGHGVADLLLRSEAARLAAGASGAGDNSDWPVICPRCGEESRRSLTLPIMPYRGFVQREDDETRGVAVRFGAAVQQTTGRLAWSEGEAVRQTLERGQRFAGTVTVPDSDVAATIDGLLAAQQRQVWVGAGRARGLGALRLTEWRPLDGDDDVQPRYDGFMAALARLCARAGAPAPEGAAYVTLTLQAPTLVPDRFGRWRVTLDGDLLAEQCGLPAGSLEVRTAFSEPARVDGWNAALGIPKPDAVGLAAGSCWLLRLQGVEPAEALAALGQLEERGLGERRQEGFGVVRVCDPLHWQVQQLEEEQSA